ncbi:HAMP domain-containing histidine kinase [Bacteroidales bacterium]|nr:HAMP domain-containing histidine kinase [Bacteroidales bacterium]
MTSEHTQNITPKWNEAFPKFKKYFFFLFLIISCTGNIIDLIFFVPEFKIIYYINIINVVLGAIVLIMYLIRIIPLQTGNILLLYLLFTNIVISLNPQHPQFELIYLRYNIVSFAITIFAGFITGKRHVIIIGIIFNLYFIFLTATTESPFLGQSFIFLLMVSLCFFSSIFFLIHMFEKNYNKSYHLTKKLQQINEHKDTLFSIIGHDLRSPFNALIGNTELIKRSLKTKIPDHIKITQYNNAINITAKTTLNTLDNLLAWVKSQMNSIEFSPSQFNLFELVSYITKMFTANATEKELTLENKIEKSLDLYADPYLLETIIRNLISNAIKFSIPGGTISIHSKTTNNSHEISITDTGIGIPHNIIDRILDPCSNYTTKGTKKESGTGLGLQLCCNFTQLHNGALKIDSRKNEGTTVSVSIPKKTN